MKYSYLTTALIASAASSSAFQAQNIQNQNYAKRTSPPLLPKTALLSSSNDENENEKDRPLDAADNSSNKKTFSQTIDTLLHVSNPLRKKPLTSKEELIYKHLVEPTAKLTGGCVALGAAGVLTLVGGIKLTDSLLKENFPETFNNKNPIERIIQSNKPSNDNSQKRFTDKFFKDKVDSSKEKDDKPKCNEETDFCRYPAINIYSIASGETAARC